MVNGLIAEPLISSAIDANVRSRADLTPSPQGHRPPHVGALSGRRLSSSSANTSRATFTNRGTPHANVYTGAHVGARSGSRVRSHTTRDAADLRTPHANDLSQPKRSLRRSQGLWTR